MTSEIIEILMDDVNDYWKTVEGKNINEILKEFTEVHSIAVKFGTFNYQVYNGGLTQWDGNGYRKEDIDELWQYTDEGVEAGIDLFGPFNKIIDELIEEIDKIEYGVEVLCSECRGYPEDGYECPVCADEGVETFYETDELTEEYDFSTWEKLDKDYYALGQENVFKAVGELILYKLKESEDDAFRKDLIARAEGRKLQNLFK